MKATTRTLVTLTALVGATAAFAAGGDQLRQRDQLKDGSCVELGLDVTSPECLLLAEQDQLQDQDQVQDQDQLKLQDGSCLDGDGTPDGDGDGAKTRTRTGAENGQGAVSRSGQ